MTRYKKRISALAISTIMTTCACITNAHAETAIEAPKRIVIPSGDLNTALESLVRQTGIQLLYDLKTVEGLRTQGVDGRLTSEQAVAKLLEGTSLELRTDPSGAVLIARPVREERDKRSQRLDSVELEQVVVTGTHIRGVLETAAPTVTITRDQIEETGYTKVEEVLGDLPQNLAEFRPGSNWADGASTAAGQNAQGVSSVSLRGLGAGSTLTLVNGKRRAPGLKGRAVDVSTIPLSMVERVEVLTGGASAIYGSDAVAGVVNLITRRKFEGMETQFSLSDSVHPGGERMQLSHVMGSSFDRGGFAIGYDYSHDRNLDLLDTGVTRFPSRSGTTLYSLSLQPELTRHGVMLSGALDVSEGVELYADGMYTRNENRFFYEASYSPDITSFQDYGTKTDSYSVALGVRADVAAAWKLDVSGVRAVSKAKYSTLAGDTDDITGAELYNSAGNERDETTLSTVSAVIDGPLPLFTLNGLTPRAATGVEYRKEEFENPQSSRSVSGGIPRLSSSDIAGERNVRSAFAELSVPIVANGSYSGLRRLELSYGVRHDSYSDFGSSLDHQGGVIWQPADSLTVRGTYATAYRAPELWYLYGAQGLGLVSVPDPARGANSVIFHRRGNGNADLTPEKAKTWSAGVDWQPTFAPQAKLSLSYFNIDYTDRIDRPIQVLSRVLIEETRYVDLIDRHPSAAQIQAILDQPWATGFTNQSGVPYDPATGAAGLLSLFPNVITVDGRTTNVAVERVRGLDLQLDARCATARGELSFGLNSTYSLDHERSITRSSPSIDMLNRVGKPVDLRVRATTGWTRGAFGAFVGVNYTDAYMDDFATVPTRIDAWTTVDLSLRVSGSKLSRASFLKDITISLSAENLLDEAPPVVLSDNEGLGYDAVNADALGRLVSMRVQKRW